MPPQVFQPRFHCLQVLLFKLLARHTPVHLQRPHRCHHHRGIRCQSRLAALDVEELLGTKVGAKARLGDDVVGEAQRRLGRNHRIAAMGDVGEGTAVNKSGVVLQGLNQVRRQCIFQQRRHGAGGLQLFGTDRLAVAGVADQYAAQPLLQFLEPGRTPPSLPRPR